MGSQMHEFLFHYTPTTEDMMIGDPEQLDAYIAGLKAALTLLKQTGKISLNMAATKPYEGAVNPQLLPPHDIYVASNEYTRAFYTAVFTEKRKSMSYQR